MARINVYLPDELAENARRAGLNVSALVQAAVATELRRRETDDWLATIPAQESGVSHEAALRALDGARADHGE